MISLVDKLSDESVWQDFYQYKITHGMPSKKYLDQLNDFIQNKKYLEVTDKFSQNSFNFSLPQKRMIAKSGSNKKRTVYIFNDDERLVLKCLTWLLFKYENKLSECCYSFRQQKSAKDAVRYVSNLKSQNWYTLKVDIHNYFNSVNANQFIDVLKQFIDDDEKLLNCFSDLLLRQSCYFNNKSIKEQMGIMAGAPFAGFFADMFLVDLDNYFLNQSGYVYLRYSDDIIVLSREKDKIEKAYSIIKNKFNQCNLELNEEKTALTNPGDDFTFLGFRFTKKDIYLADHTVKKLKDKIRRKARKLYKWRIQKGASYESAMKVLFREFNKKFYFINDQDESENEFNWCYWYFQQITKHDQLKIIDDYLLMWARYLYKGKHNKAVYRIQYNHLKSLGFRSLVNEYYRFKKYGVSSFSRFNNQ